ncbi:MAG: HAMP domain-containing protein [Chloroflexi bacterium]|nr:HAMP domain-containing protein [Chloroflexota bacterium]
MKLNSLRFRFALWVGGFLLVSLLLFGAYVYASMSRNINAAVDDALRLSATQSMGTLNVGNGRIILADSLPENNEDMGTLRARGFTVRFLDANGALLGGFGANWDRPLSVKPGAQASFSTTVNESGEANTRVFTLPVMDNNQIVGYVQTSQSLESVQQTLEQLQLSLLLGIPFLTLLAALGGYFLAGRALKPVDEITNTARRISAEDLSARLNLPDSGDELGRLASTFDEMLARLDNSFRRERQFTSDASHELRTPLAAMQTIIGVTRSRKRTSAEYEKALDDLGEETNRLRSLTEDLLMLARGEQPITAQRERVDLSALLEDVAESLTPLAEAKGLSMECRVQPNLTVRGNRDGLIRLFVNLVDNAIKFTELGSVTVSTQVEAGAIRISVSDTGRGISPEHLDHIFDRFYRADTSRTQTGAGLGLAIARQIVLAHKGEITVTGKVGEGTRITVSLPGGTE